MNPTKKSTFTIVGAGLAGCFMAILLAKRGYNVVIYERFSKDELLNNSSKRSFNITFYAYAVYAFKEAGLWNIIEPLLIPLKGSLTQVKPRAKPIFYKFGYKHIIYYCVERANLSKTLIQQASLSPLITFHFATSVLLINRQDKTMLVKN